MPRTHGAACCSLCHRHVLRLARPGGVGRVTYAPFMQNWFDTRALRPDQGLLSALAGVAVLVLLELEKALLRHHSRS